MDWVDLFLAPTGVKGIQQAGEYFFGVDLTAQVIGLVVSFIDPLYWSDMLFELIAWLISKFADDSEGGSGQLGEWVDFLKSPALSHFFAVGMFFIGLGIDQDVFLFCVRTNFAAWMMMSCVKLVLLFVGKFWGGGTA